MTDRYNNNTTNENGRNNTRNDNIDDEDEDYFADVGFMFESQQPVRLERFQWDIPSTTITTATETNSTNDAVRTTDNQQQQQSHDDIQQEEAIRTTRSSNNNNNKITIAIHVADDNPGAIQSGHYLWPAAILLSEYIIQYYNYNNTHNTNNMNNIRTVIELGAGCALSSLTALQLWKDTIQCICITDHDPGTLVRAQDNYEITIQALMENNNDDDNDNDEQMNETINTIASIPILFEILEWGNDTHIQHILQNKLPDHIASQLLLPKKSMSPSSSSKHEFDIDQHDHDSNDYNKFDIVLGSDLIYCIEVVRPLLYTIVQIMIPNYSRFILAQSFTYDTETENEINTLCTNLHLQRTITFDNFPKTNTTTNIAIETNNATYIMETKVVGRIQEFILLQ